MRKYFMLLFVMFIIYLGIQIAFFYFGKGHETIYKINNLDIKEFYIARTNNESDGYYIEINTGKNLFSVLTYFDFNKAKKVITNVEYLKTNNYECIYPTFLNNSVITDILCSNNKTVYNYHDIKGKDTLLDKKVNEIKSYNGEIFNDIAPVYQVSSGNVIYIDNLVSNHYLALPVSRGIGLINTYSKTKCWYTIDLFNKDIVNPYLVSSSGKYYMIADYSNKNSFKTFYVVDMVEGVSSKINYRLDISYNSYIMGVINNNTYLYDIDNKKQYEIDLESKNIIEIGNSSIGIQYYSNGEWLKMKSTNISKEKPKFIYNDIVGYDRVDLVGGEKTGYIYYYKKENDGYNVYRSTRQNSKQLTYLFQTSTINNIKYYKDYVYYQDGKYIKYYHDSTNVRNVYYAVNKKSSDNLNFGFTFSL